MLLCIQCNHTRNPRDSAACIFWRTILDVFPSSDRGSSEVIDSEEGALWDRNVLTVLILDPDCVDELIAIVKRYSAVFLNHLVPARVLSIAHRAHLFQSLLERLKLDCVGSSA